MRSTHQASSLPARQQSNNPAAGIEQARHLEQPDREARGGVAAVARRVQHLLVAERAQHIPVLRAERGGRLLPQPRRARLAPLVREHAERDNVRLHMLCR